MEWILVIVALVAGFFFVKKFSSIETYFFGTDDTQNGSLFLLASMAVGAFAAGWGIITGVFNLDFNSSAILFAGVGLTFAVVCGAMAYACFHSSGVLNMLGRMVFLALSCVIGALIGAAGSVIVFGIIVLVVIGYVLKFAASSSGSSSSSSSSSSDSSSSVSNNNDEVEISVDGEMFTRKAKDIGCGTYRDDRGDEWEKHFDGSLTKKD